MRLEFNGSFVSLVIKLPKGAVQGLKRNHLIGLNIRGECERPSTIFARLNVQHGPNTEQIVRGLEFENGEAAIEFDLAYSELNENRVERMWLELMFENIQMNQTNLRDLTMSRRPRAEI